MSVLPHQPQGRRTGTEPDGSQLCHPDGPMVEPSIEDQATDRAHRIGQERNVTVVRLVSANTIEEKILKLHEQKQDLSDRILEGTSGTASLTMDEILDMVSPYR